MNTRIFVIILASAFGLLIVGAIIGNILESNGTLSAETIGPKGINAITLAYFALFCVMIFAFVPLVVQFFYLHTDQNRQWRAFPCKILPGARAGSRLRLLDHDGYRIWHHLFPGQG